jgi:hypothetical protein
LIIVLLRIAACLVVIALPFVLLALSTGKQEGMLWLIFPVIFTVPALLLLACVFVPVESYAVAHGISKTKAVLIAGAAVTSLVWLAFQMLSAWSQGKPLLSLAGSGTSLRTVVIWIVLGMILGTIWRSSEWLAERFGWIPNG